MAEEQISGDTAIHNVPDVTMEEPPQVIPSAADPNVINFEDFFDPDTLNEIALQPEPERCLTWLRTFFKADKDNHLQRSQLYHAYERCFIHSIVAEPTAVLAMDKFLQKVKTVFPDSKLLPAHDVLSRDAQMIAGIVPRGRAVPMVRSSAVDALAKVDEQQAQSSTEDFSQAEPEIQQNGVHVESEQAQKIAGADKDSTTDSEAVFSASKSLKRKKSDVTEPSRRSRRVSLQSAQAEAPQETSLTEYQQNNDAVTRGRHLVPISEQPILHLEAVANKSITPDSKGSAAGIRVFSETIEQSEHIPSHDLFRGITNGRTPSSKREPSPKMESSINVDSPIRASPRLAKKGHKSRKSIVTASPIRPTTELAESVPHFQHEECSEFIQYHLEQNRRMVLITSGGTTVPLEKSNVRFIDNFSAGTRGATSAEHFLRQGYAVIFMHRQFSLQPFNRAFSHSKTSFLDNLSLRDDGSIELNTTYQKEIRPILRDYSKAMAGRTLYKVHFTSINEYLYLLREIALLMKPLSSSSLFYLAAAVSDFIVPAQRLPEHKIQSTQPTLELHLSKAPKVLQALVENEWAPQAFICSFKLETDESLLIKKAKAALSNYGHQCVVANILAKRAQEVILITDANEDWLKLKDEEVGKIEIEEELVRRIAEKHTKWMESRTSKERDEDTA